MRLLVLSLAVEGAVAHVNFGANIQPSRLSNAMTSILPNARKSKFATDLSAGFPGEHAKFYTLGHSERDRGDQPSHRSSLLQVDKALFF